MTIQQTITLTCCFISVATLLQSIEILRARAYWIQNGIWQWQTLKQEHSKLLSLFLNDSSFFCLQILGFCVSIIGLFSVNYVAVPLLFLVTLSTSVRWRGSFSGGSDYMTLLVLLTLSIALIFPQWQILALGYLALQVVLSYFVSGVSKLIQPSWRHGEALQQLLVNSNYAIPKATVPRITPHARVLSWCMLIFECSFPLALLHPKICLLYMFSAFGFHVANFYLLRLNRFIFAWLAGYPALYFFSLYLQK